MEILVIPVGYLQENCYIAYDEDKVAVVIDPGDEGQKLVEAIRNRGLDVRYILLTHGHFDHTGAVMEIKNEFGAKLCVSGEDAEMLTDPQLSLAMRQRWKPEDISIDWLLSDGDVIEAGKMRFEVIATPGHSKGSVTYRCENVLFTGDTLFQGDCGRTDLYGGSYEQIKASLRRLADLEGDYQVLPGHGPDSTLEEERLHNIYMGAGV
ncbi:MBL fold metallo-hydrolase [Zongyangia sp. HA2173]|uniref:MBL fold metallo-hydrolase n=1 Tax=Zongyangia sp. HA2173 TaxID=3133035 RepID=UPI003169630E